MYDLQHQTVRVCGFDDRYMTRTVDTDVRTQYRPHGASDRVILVSSDEIWRIRPLSLAESHR
jgi:hypothetical protein